MRIQIEIDENDYEMLTLWQKRERLRKETMERLARLQSELPAHAGFNSRPYDDIWNTVQRVQEDFYRRMTQPPTPSKKALRRARGNWKRWWPFSEITKESWGKFGE